jgi:hypothetical protein
MKRKPLQIGIEGVLIPFSNILSNSQTEPEEPALLPCAAECAFPGTRGPDS